MEKKDIEIPFGAFDSELGGFEYTIPEGYKAEIKDGKVVVRKTESDDERIRKEIIATIHLYYGEPLENEAKEMIAWLEKQGEQKPVVIPKFRIGDIIRWKKADSVEYTIKEINDKGYINTADGIMDISQTDIEFDLVEQNPAWSEEDETMLERVIKFIPQCMTAHGYNEYINWFESLKDRVQPQPKQEWSEEDCNQIETIACHLDNIGNRAMAESLLNIMDKYKSYRPQNRWKPSDEQIKVLSDLIAYKERWESSHSLNILRELLDDLKKLMEK